MGIRTILVDDEALARERLHGMLEDQAEIEIIDEAANGMEAVEKINTLQPDLVFLDVEMAGLNGFQVVQLLNRRRVPKIIFVTAYNEYAIEAFEVGAIDYLLKPVKKIRLREAIQRLGATMREPRADLTIARDLQKRIVPDKDLQSVNVECAGTCVAAHEVGGDYYSFTKVSQDRLALCIADISGKGFAAALMMANLQAGQRVLASEINDPTVLVKEINKLYYENSVPEMYATLFYGLYDGAARRFTYCNAGHNPPLVFHRGSVERLDCGGTVVGMFPESTWAQASISLHPGDVVVAYSDGIVELADPNGEEFGEQRLIALLQDNLDLSAGRLRDLLLKTVARFGAKDAPRDDMTLAILKVT